MRTNDMVEGDAQSADAVARAPQRTWAEVDRDALRNNVALLTPANGALLAMVKGNGYGHGACEVARTFLDAGARWLGVSFVDEGVTLRSAILDVPILVTTEAFAGEERRAVQAGLDLTVYSNAAIDRLAAIARTERIIPRVHIKVNTGLNRVGAPVDSVPELARRAVSANLHIGGMWTHFAVADEVENPVTDTQLARLLQAAVGVGVLDTDDRPLLHAANTAAILSRPQTHLDMVRAGIGLYGYLPTAGLPRAGDFTPALSWHASVSHVKRLAAEQGISYGLTARTNRPTTIATVPIGFADGYPRCLSNRGHILLRGRRHQIIGTIAMDQMLVDCGDQPIDVGERATLIGTQGAESITVDDLAGLAGTISDEILCGIAPRVPRRYRH